jgi:hypothetical protein
MLAVLSEKFLSLIGDNLENGDEDKGGRIKSWRKQYSDRIHLFLNDSKGFW